MTKGKMKKKKTNIFWILLLLVGFAILIYPIISRLYYRIESNNQVDTFIKGKDQLDQEEIDRRIGLARAFNDSLSGEIPEDPYAKDRQEKGKAEYARMLEVHEMIGHIEIPRINQDLPIYAGTSEEVLQKGVGHLEGTSLPIGGNNTHAVLTAHRGLPDKTLFTNLNELRIGDKFYIHNIKEILAYQVDQIKVVEPSNFDDLLIVPGHDYVTLLTCTPFMINTHRLLVRGHRVEYVKEVDEDLIKTSKANWIFRILFFIALLLILILIIMIIRLKRENKRNAKKISEIKNKLGLDDEKE
ncbi:MAG: class C sortase [Peptoniphilaceae bacterium]|nr:class C sortase [Peptoniphilaceae bacterium]MDY6018211.1 class C sortase [Anaerococcus sp.]